jgi:peptidyl-tRNA hydrolase
MFSAGLVAAQAAHISDMFMRKQIVKRDGDVNGFAPHELEWMKDPYITVLSVNCLEELEILAKEAKKEGLQVNEWRDIVVSPTMGRKIRAFVGISIGPDDSDKLALITSELPLY